MNAPRLGNNGDKPENAEKIAGGAGGVGSTISTGGVKKVIGTQNDIEVSSDSGKRRLIFDLTWPSLAENVLASLISIVDMIMVSSLGAYAINAIGLVTQPRFVLLACFMALSVGSTAMVARFKGANDRENACMVLNQSLLMTTALTIIMCAVMYISGEPLIRFIAGANITEQTIQAALVYFRIQIIGFPTLSLTFCINSILRGIGNTRASFYTNAAANVVNIFFDYCLIGGHFGFPAWGIAGASFESIIAQGTALCMAIYIVRSGKSYVDFRVSMLTRVDMGMIRRVLRIGLPAFGEQAIMRVGMMLFTIIVTSFGEDTYASHMIAMNIQMLSFTTGMAFGTAATTLMGQCLGRVKADLAKIYVKMTQNLSMIVSIIVSILLFAGGSLIASLYSKEAHIIKLAADMLKIIAVVNPISNARFVFVSALRGAGDSRFAAVVTFVGVLLLRPAISLLLIMSAFPFKMGLAGVWLGISIESVVCYIMARARYRRGKWAAIEV